MTKTNDSKTTASFTILLLALPIAVITPSAKAATSISQYGITWTFDRDYPTGQFANGDFWVVGPVKITSITPRSVTSGGVTMHGSMVNPQVNGPQAYDSRVKNNAFSAASNVGAKLPLTLSAGSSLLSAESLPIAATGDKPQLKVICILTVLGSPAPAGSFRPPPVGINKTLRWNKSQLQYGKLRMLKVAGAPAPSSIENDFKRPWIEQKTDWTGRYLHPYDSQPAYGREIAHMLGRGLLSLQLNYPNAEKEKLLIRLVQIGIDIYGSARDGAVWPAGGGHNHGRKMPMLLAGVVLGDAQIVSLANGSNRLFQEDRQTFYVTQADVGRPLYTADKRPRVPYIQADVGMAEWGEKHFPDPKWDGRNWNTYYRSVVGCSIMGHVLTARLMGLQDEWNWPALFDYADRYWSKEGSGAGGGSNTVSGFVGQVWKSFRNESVPALAERSIATDTWENAKLSPQVGAFTVSFDLLASRDSMKSVTGLSDGEASSFTDLAAAVRLSPAGFIDASNGSSFQATKPFPYTAGVKYRTVMTVDVPAQRYSVSVTPPDGERVVIANGFQFRPAQSRTTSLNNLGFQSEQGYHAVLNVGTQSPAGWSASENEVEDSNQDRE